MAEIVGLRLSFSAECGVGHLAERQRDECLNWVRELELFYLFDSIEQDFLVLFDLS